MEFDDEEEKHSTWFVFQHGDKVVACLRLREINDNVVKLERVAVDKNYRRQGIGQRLTNFALRHYRKYWSHRFLYAHSQNDVISMYLKLGFVIVSDVFEEASIDHRTIVFPHVDSITNFIDKELFMDTEEHSVHCPTVVKRLLRLRTMLQKFQYFNFGGLPSLLDPEVVSHTVCLQFADLCYSVARLYDDALAGIWGDNSVERAKYKRPRLYAPYRCWDEVADSMNDETSLFKLAHDKINTGHFSMVDENWRILYGGLSFVKAMCINIEDVDRVNYDKVLQAADMGLCIGRVHEDFVPLRGFAESIHDSMFREFDVESQCDGSPETLRPLPKSQPIKVVDNPDDFLEALVVAVTDSTPVIVKGYATQMPAVQKWSFEYLKHKLCMRTMPIEIGSKYSEDDWSQKMMFFQEFITQPPEAKMYMAQHSLLDQVPSMKEDVVIPDICYFNGSTKQDVDVKLWIGPKETVSPMHTDPRENMFVQIRGSKVVRLACPAEKKRVFPIDGMLGNTSSVDVENPDENVHRDFLDVDVLDGVVSAGDALFLPKGWWHYFRSTAPSISVSFWFD